MIRYTPEQHEVLDHATDPDIKGILLVEAGAGTGKTFIAKQIVAHLKPKKGLYTAFNKAIVEDGAKHFEGTGMSCKTLHALAYAYVRPENDIEDLSYSCIEENIPYGRKYEVITAINVFYVSAHTDVWEFCEEHFKEHESPEELSDLVGKYVNKMVEGAINPTFNFLLKYFHLMLVEGSVDCYYDLVILDEINDTTAVALEIFRLIQAPKKLGLGETNQAIYSFLNLVNGFEILSEHPVIKLTQSFRCSTRIAERIQTLMREDVSEDFTFYGTDDPVRNGKTLVCTFTNATIVQAITERLESGRGFKLLRNISEIFSLPLAIVAASQGKQVYQKKYKHLEEEYKNYCETRKQGESYLMHLLDHFEDPETKSAVALLNYLRKRNLNIFALYKKAKEVTVDEDYVIATVYTSKGLEFETVHIAEDLNSRLHAIKEKGGIEDHDDLVVYRCYYVAASRAGVNLLNAKALPPA